MTPEDLEHLERWCDGTLVGKPLDAWTTRVAGDPALQAELAAERRFVNHLRSSVTPTDNRLAAARDAAVRTRALILADRHSSRAHTVAQIMAGTRRRSPLRWWPAYAGAAAAAACLIVTWWWSISHTVARGDGTALLVGSDIPPAVRDVRFSDRSAVAIAPNSQVRLSGDAQHKRLDLTVGSVDAQVSPQTSDSSFTITTPHGEATVLGTQFRVDVAEDSSVVSVSEGRVALRSGDHSLIASAGQRMIAANGTVVLAPPPWSDHRPLGRVVLSGLMGPPGQQPASNPSGWLFDPTFNLKFGDFSARMTDLVERAIAGLRRADAQGIMLYGIEGGTHQHTLGFPGDPRRLAEFAPEFDAIADALFARLRAAGFRVGVTISPWRIERRGRTWHMNIETADTASVEAELDSRITYARKRWDCTVFYLNTAGPEIPPHIRVPTAALRAVALRHPDVLVIVENASFAHTAVAAGQALRDEVVPPGRAVARLPWFDANPTPATLAAAKANGDLLVFDPLIANQVDALQALSQPPTP